MAKSISSSSSAFLNQSCLASRTQKVCVPLKDDGVCKCVATDPTLKTALTTKDSRNANMGKLQAGYLFPETVRAAETQVLVSVLGDDLIQAAELVNELWSAKIKAEYLVHKGMNKHLERIRNSRIPWWVFVGENEIAEGIGKLVLNLLSWKEQ